jgi:hypothetical protein
MKIIRIMMRVKNKMMRVKNKLNKTSKKKIADFSKLIEEHPTDPGNLDAWAYEVQQLMQELILNRITKEDLATILTGLISYRKSGITPPRTQLALIRAYENSSGLFQDVLQKALFKRNTIDAKQTESSLFGTVELDVIQNTISEIKENGYSIFPFKLDQSLISQIKSESLSFEYQLKSFDSSSSKDLAGIDLNNPPDCVAAYAKPQSIIKSSLLKLIAEDDVFKHICSVYLDAPALAIDSTFWYSFPSQRPSSETAQFFHYDLDTVRWVKVFIYLTDVGVENGPHEYVAGSHKPENKTPNTLVRNYTRISDLDIDTYHKGNRKKITGPAGTIIFGDTRCFHKGNAVEKDYRLIYSPIFSSSLFGYKHS